MGNEKNLEPYRFDSNQSREKAAENGRKGGKASGDAKRRKKTLREAAEIYLSLPVSSQKSWNKLAKDGVDPEDVTNAMAIMAGLTIKAAKGDAKAAKVLFDLVGTAAENPAQSGVDTMTLADKMAAIREAANHIDDGCCGR